MTRTQYKRRTVAYWILLAIYSIVLAAGIVFVWKIAREYAMEYENSQSTTVVQAFIDQLNDEGWNDTMDAAARSLENNFQTADECTDIVRNSLSGEYQLSKITDTDFSKLKYRIVCDEREIGRVEFAEDESQADKVKYGMLPWVKTEESYNFDYMINGSSSITVPSTYTVKLNGTDVGEEYIVEKDIPYDVLKEYYTDYPDLPTKVKYEMSGYIGQLTPVAYNEEGEEITIDPEANDAQFLTPCEESEVARLSDFAYAFVGPYARFTGTKNFDISYPELKKYVKTGSDLDSRMQQFYEGGSTWMHWNSCEISDISFNGAYSLGGNFYVIDVTYRTTNYADYKTVDEDNIKRIVVVDDGNEILAISVE